MGLRRTAFASGKRVRLRHSFASSRGLRRIAGKTDERGGRRRGADPLYSCMTLSTL